MNFTPFHFTPIDKSFFGENANSKHNKNGLNWPLLTGKGALTAVITVVLISTGVFGWGKQTTKFKTDKSFKNGSYLGVNTALKEKDFLEHYGTGLANILTPEDLGSEWTVFDKKITKSGPLITAFIKKSGSIVTSEIRIIISRLSEYNISELGNNAFHKGYNLTKLNKFGNYSDYLMSPNKDKSILRTVAGNILIELEITNLDKSTISSDTNYGYMDIIIKRLPPDLLSDKPKISLPDASRL